MSHFRSIATSLLALTALACATQAPAPPAPQPPAEYRQSMEIADQRIAAEVRSHSELVKNLAYLTTEIGPRLTGSIQMQKASDWTLQRFKSYGLDAHLETTTIAHAWTRGHDTAEITSPIERTIPIRSLGWSRATPGTVTGTLLVVRLKDEGDVAHYRGKLKGAIVLAGEPNILPADTEVPDNAYDAVIPPSHRVPTAAPTSRRLLGQLMQQEAPAVVLLDSGKTDDLFNMGGGFGNYGPSAIPLAFLTHEDYSLLYRLSASSPVTLSVNLNGSFSAGPVPASITVAEIKGSEFPGQRVLIGGHLDSWDLGQGALDNGTGAMAVLEAARALRTLGWKPKRTLTFVLFTGEEQGGVGARLFATNHATELPDMDAALILDTGTGKVTSIALEDLYETAPLMQAIYQPLLEVFDLKPLSTRNYGASDHETFLDAGVPAYFCEQQPAHYREAHHSQADTFDKVIPDAINGDAALLAAWMWNVSEMPASLPHHPGRNSR